jgi:hypothetical protein
MRADKALRPRISASGTHPGGLADVKKLFVFGAGAAVAAAGTFGALCGAGIAGAAPDVVGKLYEDAVSEIEDEGMTATIAVTVGDRKDAMGDCIVTNATDAPFLRIDEAAEDEVLLTLNCNRGLATAAVPGASSTSELGKDFAEAEEQQAAEEAASAEEEELAEPATPGA